MLDALSTKVETGVVNLMQRVFDAMPKRAPDIARAIRKEYDSLAPGYDKNSAAWNYNGQARVFDALRPRIEKISPDVRPLLQVADIGAGTGLLSAHFKKAGFRTVAVDISMGMLKVCARETRAKEMIQHDLMKPGIQMPFNSGSVQFVISHGLLEFFQDPQPLINEMARIVTPAGGIAVTHEISKFAGGKDVMPLAAEEGGPFSTFAHSAGYIAACFARAGIKGQSQGEFVAAHHPKIKPYERTYDLFVGRPTLPGGA